MRGSNWTFPKLGRPPLGHSAIFHFPECRDPWMTLAFGPYLLCRCHLALALPAIIPAVVPVPM